MTPQYTAVMIVAPAGGATQGQGGGLGGLGSIASSLGISLPEKEQVSDFSKFRQILSSEALAEAVQRKLPVLQRLYPSLWDPATGTWRERGWSFPYVFDAVRWSVGLGPRSQPSANDVAQFIRGRVVVTQLPTAGMYQVSFEYPDPAFARDLLLTIYREADALIRARALARSSRFISYIEDRLRTVANVDHRAALVTIMSEHMKTAILNELGDVPFAAEMLQVPTVSPDPTSPRPVRTLLIAGLSVAILTGAILLIRERRTTRAAA